MYPLPIELSRTTKQIYLQYIHMYIHRQRQGGVHSNPIHGRLLLLSAHPGMPATRKTLSRGNAGQSVVSTLMHVQGASQHATDWIYPTSLTQATIVRKISMIDFFLSQSENGIGMAWHGMAWSPPCPALGFARWRSSPRGNVCAFVITAQY